MKRRDFVGLLSAVPLLPSRTLGAGLAPSYRDSLERVRALEYNDVWPSSNIRPECRTALYTHGHPTDRVVVLFHGFTNCPAQYALMARALHARGCNVLVPRYPEHGDVNRMTTRLEGLTAVRLTDAASEAIDAARGLGRRIAVSGLSVGGVLCAWLATQRPDIDRCIALAPAFGIAHVLFPISVLTATAMRSMPPSWYAWWDPVLKERITPSHAYPRYPLRTLGQCYRIGEDTITAQAPAACRSRTHMIFALNPRDPAVNNDVTVELSQRWRSWGMNSSEVWLDQLPAMHDVIEPENPHQCIARCYPPLIDLILG